LLAEVGEEHQPGRKRVSSSGLSGPVPHLYVVVRHDLINELDPPVLVGLEARGLADLGAETDEVRPSSRYQARPRGSSEEISETVSDGVERSAAAFNGTFVFEGL